MNRKIIFKKERENKRIYHPQKVYAVENRTNMTAEQLMEGIRLKIQEIIKK